MNDDAIYMVLLLLLFSCESCPTLCNPMDTRLPCPPPSPRVCSNSCPFSRWCHPTISSPFTPFPPALNLSQHQGLFQWGRSSHQVPKVLELQLQHQSFDEHSVLISFRIGLVWFPRCPRDSQDSSPAPQFKSINSLTLSLLYDQTVISTHDY